MNEQCGSRVVIDIVQRTGTVCGQVAVGDGAATEFFGWLELIDRIQSAAGPDLPGPDEPADPVARGLGS